MTNIIISIDVPGFDEQIVTLLRSYKEEFFFELALMAIPVLYKSAEFIPISRRYDDSLLDFILDHLPSGKEVEPGSIVQVFSKEDRDFKCWDCYDFVYDNGWNFVEKNFTVGRIESIINKPSTHVHEHCEKLNDIAKVIHGRKRL